MASRAPVAFEDEQVNPQTEWEKLQGACAALIGDLEREAGERVRNRTTIEERWLRDLRQFHGQYEAEVQGALDNDDARSKIFINITRPKTTSWGARLGDMLFPNDDKNWGIQPTPVPELAQEAKAAAKEAAEADAQAQQAVAESNAMAEAGATQAEQAPVLDKAAQAGGVANARRLREREIRAVLDEADRRAEAMQREIDDQLTEAKYPAVSRDIIDDACKLGTGILKGPITSSKARRRWEKQPGGNVYMLNRQPDPRPDFRRVDPWSFFPPTDAANMEDAESTFERHLLTKSRFKRMAKSLGFHAQTMRRILEDDPKFNTDIGLNYVQQLQIIDGHVSAVPTSGRYVVWEYHGPLEIEHIETMIRASGRPEDAERFREEADVLDERMVVVYFCQGLLLKIAEDFPLDSGDSLYSVFSFEKAEATVLGGVGVPWLMRHEQAMLNSAVRMMMDNGALSIGPQIVVDKSQVEPEDDSWKFRPRKVWLKKGQEVVGAGEPFKTYNIPMNQAQIAGIIELALRFIDEVVSMPIIAQGEQGAHVTQTSTGMSMLFNSANVVFRRVVKNWDDDLTTPTIRRAYDWNMQFNDKDEIKGDMQIEARGSSVLLVREVQSQQLMAISLQWSTHPVIGPAIKVYETIRMTLQTMAINPDQILVTPDEFEARIQRMAEAEQGKGSPEEIRAQAQLQVAQIDAESRLAIAESNRAIAELNQKTEIMKLIQKDGVDMKKIEAMLAGKEMDIGSSERKFAAEVAIEQQNTAEARAAGQQPTGSGGYISSGTVA
jgi:hypothetical protein